MLSWALCFFFFQAEDGIRDLTVTGVQTCALPICRRRPSRAARVGRLDDRRRNSCRRYAVRDPGARAGRRGRSEEHTSELQSQSNLVCRLLLEKKNVTRPTVT